MHELQRQYIGDNSFNPKLNEEKTLQVLKAKLQISLNLTKEFLDLEREMKGQEESFAATKTYLPYMESDQLFIATECELEDLDECIDHHGLRISPCCIKDGCADVSPGQYEYLKLVKWYDEEMEKIVKAAEEAKAEDAAKEAEAKEAQKTQNGPNEDTVAETVEIAESENKPEEPISEEKPEEDNKTQDTQK